MATKSDIITAALHNSLKGKIAEVLGTGIGDKGYGQDESSLVDATKVDLITAAKWLNLRNAIIACRKHQVGNAVGFDITQLPTPDVGTFITADIINKYEAAITQIRNDSLVASPLSMTLVPDAFTHQKSSSWAGSISAEIDVLWPTLNAARFFFNSGGELRMKFTHPTGTTANSAWTKVMTEVGTIALKARETTSTGFSGSALPKGFYDVTDVAGLYTTIFDGTDIDRSYIYVGGALDDFYIKARRIDRGVRIQIQLVEQNAATIQAGTTVKISYLKATTYLLTPTIISPTFSVVTGF